MLGVRAANQRPVWQPMSHLGPRYDSLTPREQEECGPMPVTFCPEQNRRVVLLTVTAPQRPDHYFYGFDFKWSKGCLDLVL